MDFVSDASAFLAVILHESHREWIIDKTRGAAIVSPEVLPYEIGNALIAVMKKGRLDHREILGAFEASQRIPVQLVPVTIPAALQIATRFNIYAYDAYYLQCCLEKRLPLISLDERMRDIAEKLEIKVAR
jgi:predicted nucleic acid-binding protein